MFVQPNVGGMDKPQAMVYGGPTKDFFVADGVAMAVLQFDGLTGRYERSLGGGTVGNPTGLAFGPDGKLYVASATQAAVYKFNTSTALLEGTFVSSNAGGLSSPRGMAFSTAGHLYIADFQSNLVKHYDSAGAFVGDIGVGVLGGCNDVVFSGDGGLLVNSTGTFSVEKFNPTSGTYVGQFVAPGSGGLGMGNSFEMSPDGKLFIIDQTNSKVLRYDGTTGAYIDIFQQGALGSPIVGTFAPGLRKVVGVAPSQDGVAGGSAINLSVYLNGPALPGGCNVNVSSSNTGVVTVPSVIKVPQGLRGISFFGQTKGQTQDATAIVTATRGATVTTEVYVFRSTVSNVSVTPGSVTGGSSATGTVSLSGTAPTGGANVLLSSSNSAVASVPSVVTVAAAARSKSFTVATFAVASAQIVTLTATRAGVTATTTLSVTP
jgi:sugar lactone lactonase YvrE